MTVARAAFQNGCPPEEAAVLAGNAAATATLQGGGSAEQAVLEAYNAVQAEGGSPEAVGMAVGKATALAGGNTHEAKEAARRAVIQAGGKASVAEKVSTSIETFVEEEAAATAARPLAAKTIQAAIRGRRFRDALGDKATSLLAAEGGLVRGEYVVEHTWVGSERLGFRVIGRSFEPEARQGIIVSEVTDTDLVPSSIKPGMLLESVQGQDLSSLLEGWHKQIDSSMRCHEHET